MIKNMLSLPDLKLLKTDTLLKKSLLPLLEKNQVVDAKVLKLISPSKAELLILGKKVLADTSTSANLAKGDTIQLKVTAQGQLNILKVTPEQLIPEKAMVGNVKPPVHLLTTSVDSTLQFFAKNQPFEGFTKLAAALFPTLKNNPAFEKDTPALAKKESPTLVKESPVIKSESPGLVKADKVILSRPTEQTQTQPDKTVIADKMFVSHSTKQPQPDKTVADKTDIKNLLLSVALKSEKADVNFLPRLIQRGGIMMEKKLSDMVKKGLETLSKYDSASQSSSASPSPSLTHSPLSTEIFANTSSDQTTQLSLNSSTFIQEDIKGAVLNFIANSGAESFQSVSVAESATLKDIHIFKEFIQNLENVQLLNSHLSESGKYIIPFPLFSGDQFSFGQLFIDLGHKDKENGLSKENSLLKVSLFLEMTNLGPIRADFSVLKNNITGGFQVSDEETANFFRLMLPELKERLQIHEYNVHRIECRVVEPGQLAEKSIINELLQSEEHGLSVMI